MLCGLALEVPEFHIQRSMVVDKCLMMVFEAERRRWHLWRAFKTSRDRTFLQKVTEHSAHEFLEGCH